MDKKHDILPGDESLEREAPLLHSISKENPFSVPQNYFDSLPSEIIQKCREEAVSHKSSVASKSLISYIVYFLSYNKFKLLAAAGCVLIICIFVSRLNNRPVSYEAMAQNIPDSLIVEHLDNNISSVNESTLEEMDEGQSNNSQAQTKAENTDQDIIAYLIDHDITVNEIESQP